MRLGSIQATFKKIERYLGRRLKLKIPVYRTRTVYALDEDQLAELDSYPTVEHFFLHRVGSRVGTEVAEMRTTGAPLSHDDIEDFAEDIVKAVWDCKDRIWKRVKTTGVSRKQFFDEVKQHHELCVVADLANTIKHDGLDKPPLSGIRPVINGVRESAKGAGSSAYRREGDTIIAERTLSDFEIFAGIRDLGHPANEIGEVFAYCEKAITQWEAVIQVFGVKLVQRSR